MDNEDANKLVRLSVNMNMETAQNLDFLSTVQGVSKTEVIRRAVAMMKWIEDEQRKGRQIVTMNQREKDWRVLVLV